MINYDTILSTSEDKLTLMKWLQKVETALKDASLSSVTINQPTAESVILTFHFADGTQLQSPVIALPRGPKGDTGATGATGEQGVGIQSMHVVNGNLMITLTNGQIINAGYIGEGVIVDNELSPTSENPVQNKVIAAEIETLHENELPAVQRSFVSNEYAKTLGSDGRILHAIDVEGVTLWENANPRVSFPKTDIQIEGLSRYRYIDLYVFTSTYATVPLRFRMKIPPFFGDSVNTPFLYLCGGFGQETKLFTRRVTFNKSINEIRFEVAYEDGAENNNDWIPYMIVGIK